MLLPRLLEIGLYVTGSAMVRMRAADGATLLGVCGGESGLPVWLHLVCWKSKQLISLTAIFMDRIEFENFMAKCEVSEGTLGNSCTILRDTEQNQMVLMKEIEIYSNDEFKTMSSTLLKQKQLYHEHLLSLIDFYASPDVDSIVTFYEYSTHSLIEEVEARILDENAFTAEELENILVSVLKALDYLENEATGHGCVSPTDICLAEGLVKIVDPSIASSSPLSIHEGYYYSPELMAQIKGDSEEDIDIFKNDIFCLALCILQCGLLESCEDCYDYQEGTFNFEKLEEKVQKFHQMYGDRLVKILLHMLDENGETRYNPKQLFEVIQAEFEQEEEQLSRRESDFESSQGYSLSSFCSSTEKSNEWSNLLSSHFSNSGKQTALIQNPIIQIKKQKKMMKRNQMTMQPHIPEFSNINMPPAFTKPKKEGLTLAHRQSNKENGWTYR